MSGAKRKAAERLIGAVLTNNHTELKSLLSAGLDPNSTDDRGVNALMVAAGRGKLGLVKLLLSYGADVNCQDFQGCWPLAGRTALMFAAADGCLDIVKELITRGANLNAQDSDGETALMKAAFTGNYEIVQYLILSGADTKIQNEDDKTAMTLAENIGQVRIVELLKRKE
ncbi:MAG: ankyrin repeat domain-containing protein [Blastocatellales bacterium]